VPLKEMNITVAEILCKFLKRIPSHAAAVGEKALAFIAAISGFAAATFTAWQGLIANQTLIASNRPWISIEPIIASDFIWAATEPPRLASQQSGQQQQLSTESVLAALVIQSDL
jgi:hypothetical protein